MNDYRRALEVASAIQRESATPEAALEAIAEFLLGVPGVHAVVAAENTSGTRPGDGWVALGTLGWLKHWFAPDVPPLALGPLQDSDPLDPLLLPTISVAAQHTPVVITDVAALTESAPVDYASLSRRGVRAYAVVTANTPGRNGASISVVSAVAQPHWEEKLPAILALMATTLAALIERAFLRDAAGEALQASQEAARRQRAFFAAVGHNLRTPTAEIVAAAEAAQSSAELLTRMPETIPAQRVRELGHDIAGNTVDILEASTSLESMISKLLVVAAPATVETVDVHAAIHDVLAWSEPAAVLHAVTLATGAPTTPGPRAAGFTATGLRWVLRELVSQAVAVTDPSGSVQVDVTTAGARHDRVVVRLLTSGPALAPEQAAALLAAPADALLGTTSLTLAYTAALVDQAGARLSATSTVTGVQLTLDTAAATS